MTCPKKNNFLTNEYIACFCLSSTASTALLARCRAFAPPPPLPPTPKTPSVPTLIFRKKKKEKQSSQSYIRTTIDSTRYLPPGSHVASYICSPYCPGKYLHPTTQYKNNLKATPKKLKYTPHTNYTHCVQHVKKKKKTKKREMEMK